MKKFFLTFVFVLVSILGFSQVDKNDLPAFYIEGTDTVGVIISVEQAHRINKDLDILQLLERKGLKLDSLEQSWAILANNYEENAAFLRAIVAEKENLIATQEEMITNKGLQVVNVMQQMEITQKQFELQEQIGRNLQKKINWLQAQKWFFLGGGLIITGVPLVIILMN